MEHTLCTHIYAHTNTHKRMKTHTIRVGIFMHLCVGVVVCVVCALFGWTQKTRLKLKNLWKKSQKLLKKRKLHNHALRDRAIVQDARLFLTLATTTTDDCGLGAGKKKPHLEEEWHWQNYRQEKQRHYWHRCKDTQGQRHLRLTLQLIFYFFLS